MESDWPVACLSFIPASLDFQDPGLHIAQLFFNTSDHKNYSGREGGSMGGLCSLHGRAYDILKLFTSKKTHLWSKHVTQWKSQI